MAEGHQRFVGMLQNIGVPAAGLVALALGGAGAASVDRARGNEPTA